MTNKENPKGITRAEFIRRVAAASGAVFMGGNILASCVPESGKKIAGKFYGPNHDLGHKLRDGFHTTPFKKEKTGIAIVGGGVAGLSAGWYLKKNGFTDFTLFELEPEVGGNSAWGENEISAFPWGAHYLPVPGLEQPELLELLADFDVVTGYSEAGLPIFKEEHLCASPQERLLINGIWQEGLIPTLGISPKDKEEIDSFLDYMEAMKQQKGADGKFAFAIPESNSSTDPEFRKWDEVNMATFMDKQNWHSPYLHWYVNYSLRDDFGATLKNTSAWAGLHYFASRRGAGTNTEPGDVLTWQEGNGWLVKKMREYLREHIQVNSLIFKAIGIEDGTNITVAKIPAGDPSAKFELTQFECEKIILATPQFVNQRLIPERIAQGFNTENFDYAPWVTANITVEMDLNGRGKPLSWDNIAYHSPSLGYIHAAHQEITGFPSKKRILTWYHVLSGLPPKEARQLLYDYPISYWQDFILADLESMHKGINKHISNIDVWRWGHGMISPKPGFMNSKMRQLGQQPFENVHFAHSDLSGISIFEEAFYQGLRAGREVLP